MILLKLLQTKMSLFKQNFYWQPNIKFLLYYKLMWSLIGRSKQLAKIILKHMYVTKQIFVVAQIFFNRQGNPSVTHLRDSSFCSGAKAGDCLKFSNIAKVCYNSK